MSEQMDYGRSPFVDDAQTTNQTDSLTQQITKERVKQKHSTRKFSTSRKEPKTQLYKWFLKMLPIFL